MILGGLGSALVEISKHPLFGPACAFLGWCIATWRDRKKEASLKKQAVADCQRAINAEKRAKEAAERETELLRIRRDERVESERDRKELDLIRERARVPYFRLLDDNPGSISITPNGELDADPSNGIGNRSYCGRILRSLCPVADPNLPEASLIYLLASNAGEGFQELSATMDGQPIAFGFQKNYEDPGGLHWFRYPHVAQKHGASAKISISFLALGGTIHTHLYETRRGHFELRRIHPESIGTSSTSVGLK